MSTAEHPSDSAPLKSSAKASPASPVSDIAAHVRRAMGGPAADRATRARMGKESLQRKVEELKSDEEFLKRKKAKEDD